MKRAVVVLVAMLLLASVPGALAQTAVTATVVDSDGTPWANGTCTALYAPVPGYLPQMTNAATGRAIAPNPVSCTLNGSGVLSISLVPTADVFGPVYAAGNSPGVVFTVCPAVTPGSCQATAPVLISGASQDVSAQINAVIKAPRINGLAALAQAYADVEVAAVAGNQYTRLSDGAQRCYSGSSWTGCGSGSGTVSSGTTGQVGYYASNGTTISGENALWLPLAGGALTGPVTITDTTVDYPLILNVPSARGFQVSDTSTGGSDNFYIGDYGSWTEYIAYYWDLYTDGGGGGVHAMRADASGNVTVLSGAFGVGSSTTPSSDPFYVTTAGAAAAASLAVGPIIAAGTQTISGCSLTSAVGGASAGSFHSGTSGTCTVTIAPGNTAPNGFRCSATDLTTSADVVQQTATSATTCTIAGTTVSGDLITWQAIAF